MILTSLVSYYDRLLSSQESCVAQFGASPQKITYCIRLNLNGQLQAISNISAESDGKFRPRPLIVPHPGGKRSSNIKPYFLWDKLPYVLGRDPKLEMLTAGIQDDTSDLEDKKLLKKLIRVQDYFIAFKQFNTSILSEIECKEAEAVCTFLNGWSPDQAGDFLELEKATEKNFVFSISGQNRFVHEIHEIKQAWLAHLNRKSSSRAPSLITGEVSAVPLIHIPIKGIIDPGGQSEKSIISFNKDKTAFTSFEKIQGLNAPLAEHDAFRYCTALNYLLSDHRRKVWLGDTTMVFWSAKPHPIESIFGQMIGGIEDESTIRCVEAFLGSIRQGIPAEIDEDAETPFFILGLAPNASRLSVRFWHAGNVGSFRKRLVEHVQALELSGAPEGYQFPNIRRLVGETVMLKNGFPDDSRISPVLTGEVARSILTGTPYPRTLLSSVVRRIRTEGFVNSDSSKNKSWRAAMHRRASIIKACLVRGSTSTNNEIPMSLKKNHSEIAYQLGRLFAALEKTQTDAYGDSLNSTIRSKYMGSASATPSVVFPRILRLHTHHLAKMEHPGQRINREKLVTEICGRMDASTFPSHLSIEAQGLFFLGYYQQRQDLYKSKNTTSTETATA